MDLVPLAVLMLIATYPSRALPMLAPGVDRLPPRAAEYLRLAGPAALAALAAVNTLFAGTPPTLNVGVSSVAVVVGAIVAWRWSLLPGVALAAAIVALARALGAG